MKESCPHLLAVHSPARIRKLCQDSGGTEEIDEGFRLPQNRAGTGDPPYRAGVAVLSETLQCRGPALCHHRAGAGRGHSV